MKTRSVCLLAAAFVSAWCSGGPAAAQVVLFDETFDSGLSANASLSGYSFGDVSGFTDTIVSGIGLGGTPGLQLAVSAAALGNGYAGAAAQLQEQVVAGNTSANLGDYILSFDANATAGSLNIQVQTWTGTHFGGSMTGTLNTAPANPGYGNDQTLNATYTHYSLNLGDLGAFPNEGTFSPLGGTWQIAFQFNGGANGIPSSLTLNLDNIEVTQVPEPGTFALAGLGMAALLIFRRRH